MSSLGILTALSPPGQDPVTETSKRAEDNARKVVKALLAVHEVAAVDLGAYLKIGKSAIYARLRGEKPFALGEIAVLSEFFTVPIEVFYTGPETLFGVAPEPQITRSRGRTNTSLSTPRTVRAGVIVQLDDARAQRREGRTAS